MTAILSKPKHHGVFSRFTPWEGVVQPGFRVNFLGVRERESFTQSRPTHCKPVVVRAELPIFHETYFEWIELLEAVIAARDRFTMIELGAGYGRWMVCAAAALRAIGGPVGRFVGVEAEETHFAWLPLHFRDNGVDPGAATLIHAAVGATDGQAVFQTGAAREWYGQCVQRPERRVVSEFDGQTVELKPVRQVSLATLLEPLDCVDLIDLDVQGAELDALAPAAAELDRKVKRVFIGTHWPTIDDGLRELFTSMGWRPRFVFPCKGWSETEYGRIEFEDGVQSWHNPRFVYQ